MAKKISSRYATNKVFDRSSDKNTDMSPKRVFQHFNARKFDQNCFLLF